MNIADEARNAIDLVAPHFGQDAYDSKIDYESRVFALFEKIDGVDVLLYVLYISEFGENACEANRNTAYISYLDSINYMRPRFLRTPIYHTILCGYLADAKQRDFHSVHIWACPPSRGADYIFHRHPKGQRTPGWERLRLWYVFLYRKKEEIVLLQNTTSFNTLSETHRYNKMLVRAFKENTVIDAGTLYEDHFTLPFSKQLRKNTAPPYFPRHHWLKQLGMIEVAQGVEECKQEDR